jgi:Dna[CI] antecedent DciA-like protein
MSRGKFTAPVRVSEVLAAAVPELGERLLEETIRKEWRLTVGADMARRSQPAELRSGTLTVIVDNSPWLQELTLRSAELLELLRGRYGTKVSAVRFALGRLADRPEPPQRRRPEPETRLTDSQALEVETTGSRLSDPTLAAAVRRLMTKDLIARRQARPTGAGDRREDA